jgi:acyl-CoA thioesterase-1
MHLLPSRPALVSLAALLLTSACGGEDRPPTGFGGPSAGTLEVDATSAAEAEAESGPVVVFLGDSLSAGLHLPADEAFPVVLQERLATDGVPFRLINAGVSGDTTAGGLRRIDWLLRHEPDWVVVELGGNDGLRGTPVETIEANLRAIVGRAQEAGAKVLLCGMRLPPNYGADYVTAFASLFERVAADEELPFVPFLLEGVAGVPELNLPDQLHPTAEGHRRIADNLAPILSELLRAPRDYPSAPRD